MSNALVHDPVIIGVLRLAIVVVALYGIESVPALIVGGRWAKGLGTSGIVADDARVDAARALETARRELAELASENEDLRSERAELWNLMDAETSPK